MNPAIAKTLCEFFFGIKTQKSNIALTPSNRESYLAYHK